MTACSSCAAFADRSCTFPVGIRTLDGLRAAVAGGSVSLDPAQRIGLRHADEFRQKIPRAEARRHEEALLSARDASLPAMQLVVCGSYRRGKATSGDIDALVTPTDGATPASLLARWCSRLAACPSAATAPRERGCGAPVGLTCCARAAT